MTLLEIEPDYLNAPSRITPLNLVNNLGEKIGTTRTSPIRTENSTKSATYLRDSPQQILSWNADYCAVERSYSTYAPRLRLRILSAQF